MTFAPQRIRTGHRPPEHWGPPKTQTATTAPCMKVCMTVCAAGMMAGGAQAHGIESAIPPLPPEVRSALPVGVTPSAVYVEHGCYFYLANGVLHPLTLPWTGDQPYCVQ